MRAIIALAIIAVLIGFVGRTARIDRLRIREVVALEEIAVNTGEIAMSLDNIVSIDEVLDILGEHLPKSLWR